MVLNDLLNGSRVHFPRIKDLRFELLVLILEDLRLGEVFLELGLPLDSAVLKITDLLRVVVGPSLSIIISVEVENISCVEEVDEGVSDVTVVSIVNWQVEEVKPVLMPSIDLSEHLLHVVLIRDVLDHDRCSMVFKVHDLV